MQSLQDERIILDLSKFGIDAFEEFGRYKNGKAQGGLLSHSHDAVEFCYLSKGRQTYLINKDSYKMRGGDLFFTKPGELHSTGPYLEEKGVLYWFSLRKPIKDYTCLGLNHNESHEIYSRLINLPNRLFRSTPEIEFTLQQIFKIYFQNHGAISGVTMKVLILSLLIKVIDCGEKNKKEESLSSSISDIVAHIEENIFDDFPLEYLAGKCCLSLSRFKHRFKEEIGMPPTEFISRKKIEKAKSLLKDTNVSITDISYNLGFSSPSYFSTVFKQYTGMSPSVYQSFEFEKNTCGFEK